MAVADAEGVAARQPPDAVEVRPVELSATGGTDGSAIATLSMVPGTPGCRASASGEAERRSSPPRSGVEERMHAVGVARAEQEILAGVPDDEREEAPDPVEHALRPSAGRPRAEAPRRTRPEARSRASQSRREWSSPSNSTVHDPSAREAVRRSGAGAHLEPPARPPSERSRARCRRATQRRGRPVWSASPCKSAVRMSGAASSSSTSRASSPGSTSYSRASRSSSSAWVDPARERVPEGCRGAVQLVDAVGLQVDEHDLVVDPLREHVRIGPDPRVRRQVASRCPPSSRVPTSFASLGISSVFGNRALPLCVSERSGESDER